MAGYDRIKIELRRGGRAMGERTYLAIDLNNAEKKEMPILSAKAQKVVRTCKEYRHYRLI